MLILKLWYIFFTYDRIQHVDRRYKYNTGYLISHLISLSKSEICRLDFTLLKVSEPVEAVVEAIAATIVDKLLTFWSHYVGIIVLRELGRDSALLYSLFGYHFM